jgi:ribosome maturation factor RimP
MIDVKHIEQLVNQKLSSTDYYLLDCTVSRDNQIVVILDGDTDVSIDKCMEVSRYLEASLDREREDFELQVTSYGADMPLTNMRQYRKYLNRPVKIINMDDEKMQGILLQVDEQKITLEPIIPPKKKGQKPKKGEPVEIHFETINEIKPVMKF